MKVEDTGLAAAAATAAATAASGVSRQWRTFTEVTGETRVPADGGESRSTADAARIGVRTATIVRCGCGVVVACAWACASRDWHGRTCTGVAHGR